MLMLITPPPDKDVDRNNQGALLGEFGKLSGDRLLRDEGIMLVTIDANDNRMLMARMGVSTR